jgi:16S rRNA (cytosine1402-N4)-methyltransferase
MEHYSVLLNESVEALNIKKNGIYVDCTLGRAGHTSAILNQLGPDGKIVAFDQDIDAIKKVEAKLNDGRLILVHDNFKNLKTNLVLRDILKVDGIFYDLGVSSPQFDEKDRGFSYRFDAELDMRMDRTNNSLTAKKIINEYDAKAIADILFKFGDEKFSHKIAANIVQARTVKEISTTFELVEIIKNSLPQKILKQKKHPAKKTFQALRIYVNDELNAIDESLNQAISLLKPNAILAVITFHSLEEQIVKTFMRRLANPKVDFVEKRLPIQQSYTSEYKLETRKPIIPTENELDENRRSHSAKLWVLKKLEVNNE